jgi:hypothetical protein
MQNSQKIPNQVTFAIRFLNRPILSDVHAALRSHAAIVIKSNPFITQILAK